MTAGTRGDWQYQFDPGGQMLASSRPGVRDGLERFAWDAAGNLLDAAEGASAGRGNRLTMWQDIRPSYDAWGNLGTKRSGSRQVQRFVFDDENRLLAVKTKSGRGSNETRFEYDALGRRIGRIEQRVGPGGRREGPAIERRFVWQGLRMVQELRETGLSNYVYSPDDDYAPMARVDASIEQAAAAASADAAIAKAQQAARSGVRTLHFHTDLVGAPLEVTTQEGELAWQGDYSAWGRVEYSPKQALDNRIEQPLRYAGQYADDSTGLHYNTFRYYDPEVGRFISQDPIGINGGTNLYAYAPNSTKWIDPWGLDRLTFTDSQGLTLDVDGYTNLDHLSDAQLKTISYMNGPEAPHPFGLSPTDAQGNRIVLHHMNQQTEGPIQAMPEKWHQANSSELHPSGNVKGGGITNREAFNSWKKEFWKSRADGELTRRGC